MARKSSTQRNVSQSTGSSNLPNDDLQLISESISSLSENDLELIEELLSDSLPFQRIKRLKIGQKGPKGGITKKQKIQLQTLGTWLRTDYISPGGVNLSRSLVKRVVRDAGNNTPKSYILPNPSKNGDTSSKGKNEQDEISKSLVTKCFENTINYITEKISSKPRDRKNVLLFQSKAGKFDVKVKLGGIFFQGKTDCAVIIQVELSPSAPGLRCAFLKLECEVDQEVDGSEIIKDMKPSWSRGEAKKTKRSQNAEYGFEEKRFTGVHGTMSHSREINWERRLTINGFIKCVRRKERLARWTLSENGSEANGIPPGFQGVFFLGSRKPFRLTVKVCVNLFGSIQYWWFTPHRGSKAAFNIDPELFRCDENIQFQDWTGALGDYKFFPYAP